MNTDALWRATSAPTLADRVLGLLHARLDGQRSETSVATMARRLDAAPKDIEIALAELERGGRVARVRTVLECRACGAIAAAPAEHNTVGTIRCPAGAGGFRRVPEDGTAAAQLRAAAGRPGGAR